LCPPAARARSRPAITTPPSSSAALPNTTSRITRSPGSRVYLADSDVARGLGDPKPRFVDAGTNLSRPSEPLAVASARLRTAFNAALTPLRPPVSLLCSRRNCVRANMSSCANKSSSLADGWFTASSEAAVSPSAPSSSLSSIATSCGIALTGTPPRQLPSAAYARKSTEAMSRHARTSASRSSRVAPAASTALILARASRSAITIDSTTSPPSPGILTTADTANGRAHGHRTAVMTSGYGFEPGPCVAKFYLALAALQRCSWTLRPTRLCAPPRPPGPVASQPDSLRDCRRRPHLLWLRSRG
jgi:hypothetical protein